MTIRTLALLSLILALPPSLAAAAEPANPTAEPARHAGSAERDVWPDHAVPDADAARQGRSALPFTQEQIETLGRLLRQTQRASARGAGAPPQGRIRRIRLDAPGDGQIPVIALRRGYTTVLSFTGMTGAPWPIAEAVLDSRFLPPGQEAAPEAANPGAGHLLYLAPQQAYLDGNAVVTLAGLAEPLVVALRGTGGAADFRVISALPCPGPTPIRSCWRSPKASTPAIRCCSACSAAPCRRTPNGLPSRAAATKAAPGGRAAICCWSPAHICFRPAPGQPSAAPAAAGPTACRTPRGGRERERPGGAAFVPLNGNHGRTEGDRQ